MVVKIRNTKREPGNIRLLFIGDRNSGKTKTAMGTAQTLANGRPFIGIDLETHDGVNPASSLYADTFPLYEGVIHLPNVTHPQDFLEAMKTAYKSGSPVLFIDGLYSLQKGVNAWAAEIDPKDTHAAHKTVKPVLNEALDMLFDYPGHVVATCLMTPKARRGSQMVKGVKKSVITTEPTVLFSSHPIAERFGLTVLMEPEPPRDKDGNIIYPIDPAKVKHRLTTYKTKVPEFMAFNFLNPGRQFAQTLYEWARMELLGEPAKQGKQPPAASHQEPEPELTPGSPYDPDSLWDYHDWSLYFTGRDHFISDLERAIKAGYIAASDDDMEAAQGLMEFIKEDTGDE